MSSPASKNAEKNDFLQFSLFEDFFASGNEESISPFLTPQSRAWGKNLPIKASFLAAFLLIFSYTLFSFKILDPLSCSSLINYLLFVWDSGPYCSFGRSFFF